MSNPPRAISRSVLVQLRYLRHVWLLLASLIGGCASLPPMERLEFTRLQMGVEARVVLYATSQQRETARDAAAQAFSSIAALEQIMSDYRPGSELMQLCARAGDGATVVSDDLFAVLQTSLLISKESDGAFDVTVAPLSRLWRGARQKGRLPGESDIAEARRLVDWRNVVLNERARTVELRVKGMSLDLGGIAKGYAAERAVRVLSQRGFNRCLVALAGDIAVGDPPPNAEGWKIAIAPHDDDDDDGAKGDKDRRSRHVLLANACISTSGDTEQFIEIDGVRHSHIIDPRTGYGITNPINVTVIARRGEIADGLASAISVMGYLDIELARSYRAATIVERITPGGVEPVVVDPNQQIRWSD